MSAWYTIAAVESSEPRAWSSQEGGKFESWRVTLRNAEGRELGNVEINKKPRQDGRSSAPTVGSEHYGDVDMSGQHGPKFGYAKPPDGSAAVRGGSGGGGSSSAGGGSSSGGGSGGGYYRPHAPEDLAAMRRAHAQEMALRALALLTPPYEDEDALRGDLDRWTAHFEGDVAAAASGATEQEPEQQASSPPPAQQQQQDPGPPPGDPGHPDDPPPPADDDIPF